jgi:GT2 family glycosyltransferase
MTDGCAQALTIGVLISTYRRPEALAATLGSLVRQRRAPDQVIVAMTSSDAATRHALLDLRPDCDFDLTVVAIDSPNLVAKENAGARAARTDVVCYLDDDAIAPIDWLERIERHFSDASVGAVGGRDVLPNHDTAPATRGPIGRLDVLGRVFANHHRPHGDRVLEVDFLKGCNMCFRREQISMLDARLIGEIAYGFEIDMGLSVRSRGLRVLYDPGLAVEHDSVHDMSAARADLAFITNHNHTYILLKHLSWPRRAVFLGYTLLIGDRSTAGLMRIAWMAARHRWPRATCTAHMSGKFAGVRSFARWRSAQRPHSAQNESAEGRPIGAR